MQQDCCSKNLRSPQRIADIKEEVNVEELLSDVTLAKLQTIFHSVMKKQVDKIESDPK